MEVNNDDFYFGYYTQSEHKKPIAFTSFPPVLASLDLTCHSEQSPISLAALSFPFNLLLDSGCTNHIFRDRAVFWTYDTTLATPVKTANCGFLSTLARGSVRFRLKSGSKSAIFVLKDCLHAPDAPVNLLLVGAMTEKGATFTFAPGCTSIVFPTPQPSLPDFSFTATLMHRLSFLHCNFVTPSSQPSSVHPTAVDDDTALVATFPAV